MSAHQEPGEVTAVAVRLQDISPDYAEIIALSRVFQASGYYRDVRDAAQAVVKIIWGREMGFSPVISMSGIFIIEGKPALSSNLMATLIKRSGKYDYRVTAWTDEGCTLTFMQRVDGKWENVGTSSFTMEDAKRANLVKAGGSWAKYPRSMTFARALSQGLRTYCPDVSAAPIYNPEEMGAVVNEDGDLQELPKSARQVEVTEHDIPISKPEFRSRGNSAAEERKGPSEAPDKVGGQIGGSGHGNAAAEAVGSVSTERASTAPAPDALTAAVLKTADRVMPIPGDCIEQNQAVNFETEFKRALKPALRKDAQKFSHDWLQSQGIVDADGNPTAKAIKKATFYETREMALQWAKEL